MAKRYLLRRFMYDLQEQSKTIQGQDRKIEPKAVRRFERVVSASQVQEDGHGLFIMAERVEYVQENGPRKPLIKQRRVFIPESFATVVEQARETNRLLHVRFVDDGSTLRAEDVE